LRKIINFLDNYLEEILVISLLVFLVVTVNIEVFRRYLLNSSGAYSEEIARFALIWMVYLGVPYAIRRNRHIVCDVLPSSIPRKVNLGVNILSYILFLIFAVVMTYENYQLILNQIAVDKRTEAMYAPMWWFSMGIGIGFGLAVLRLLQTIYLNLKELFNFSQNNDPEKQQGSDIIDCL